MKRTQLDSLNEGADNPDDEPVSKVERYAPQQAQPAIDIAAIVKAAVEAALSAGRANTEDLSDAITKGMQQVATPKHENVESNGVSHANPLGDLKHPRPGLKCEMWWGVIADDGKIGRAGELLAGDCTVWEQLALNMLEPVKGVIECHDGDPIKIAIEPKHNSITGELERLILALPQGIVGAGSERRNMVPDWTNIVYQLTGCDFRPKSLPFPAKADDLAWFMAEHRAGRYVAVRPKEVAA